MRTPRNGDLDNPYSLFDKGSVKAPPYRSNLAPHALATTAGATKARFLVGFMAVVVNLNALRGGFVYDDLDNVLRNPWVREPGRLGEAFSRHMAAFSAAFDTSYYRPIMHVLLAAAHSVSGASPWAYHLLLILIHAGASLAVLALIRRFAPAPPARVSSPSLDGALVGALLFAVHPVHAEAIAWVSGVVDSSYSLLFLLALLAATAGTRWVRLGLAPVLFLLSLLGKEPAVALLPVIGVLYFVRGDLAVRETRRAAFVTLAAMTAALCVYLTLRISALGGLMGTGGARRVPVGLWEGILTSLILVAEYARLLLLPWGLSAVHDVRVATWAATPMILAGAAVVVATGALAWRLRRSVAGTLGLSLTIFPLLPALYVPVLGQGLVGERYLYLPSAGLALLVGLAWNSWPAPSALAGRIRAAVALTALSGACIATISRNAVWRDDLSLWEDAASKSPNSAAAHEYLGYALLVAGRPADSINSLTRALEIDPRRVDARANLASALGTTGRLDEALQQAEAVLRERPRQAESHAIRGTVLESLGRSPEAIAAYLEALKINPYLATVHARLGILLARQGNREGAMRHLAEAARLDPGEPRHAEALRLLSQLDPSKDDPRRVSPGAEGPTR